MAYVKRPNQPEATITRRGFLSAAAAVAGGVTVFSLPGRAFPDAFFSHEGEVYDLWKGIRAINEGRFAVAPALMHSILGSAVFAQSIGMLWTAYAVAPYGCDLKLSAEMQKFYEAFYGIDYDENMMAHLLGENY